MENAIFCRIIKAKDMGSIFDEILFKTVIENLSDLWQ